LLCNSLSSLAFARLRVLRKRGVGERESLAHYYSLSPLGLEGESCFATAAGEGGRIIIKIRMVLGQPIKIRKSKDEDIVQPLLKDNGYFRIVLFNVI
jgi:hypothetical protein